MFRNCQYLLHYQATGFPLPVYNHNLDKTLRCDEKCDPERLLPQPFPLFQEERAHINSQMNSTIVTYSQCLTAVGIISPLAEESSSLNLTGEHPRTEPSLQANLTTATWSNSSDIKWSTCASLKTFVRWQKRKNARQNLNLVIPHCVPISCQNLKQISILCCMYSYIVHHWIISTAKQCS